VGLERITVLKVVGILFAVAGAVVIEAWHTVAVDVDVGAEEANVPLGLSIVIMQVFAMANVIVFQKELVMKFDPSLVAFSYYTIGTAITIILCTVLHNQFSWSDFLFHGHLLPWLGLAYAAIFATLFAYNAYAWAGKILRPSVTTIYCTLQPVGTAVLSLFFLHQSPEVGELIGGIGVILGLFVTVYGNRDEERRQLLMMSIDHKSDSDSDSDLGAMAMAVDAHYSALKGASDCDNDHSDVATTD
jgi:drug/metabolite transporter (DMT)-like permease